MAGTECRMLGVGCWIYAFLRFQKIFCSEQKDYPSSIPPAPLILRSCVAKLDTNLIQEQVSKQRVETETGNTNKVEATAKSAEAELQQREAELK